MKLHDLNDFEKQVILHKGTERPFTGEYNDFYESGVYICKHCSLPLYTSESKFKSGCGWPAYDDSISNHVLRVPDADGMRTEIVCNRCKGHLGHVFEGERFTETNTRHCVNSVSVSFVREKQIETATFGGGCFWGVEYLFKQQEGVLLTQCGYSGGTIENPSYELVCSGQSGHIEVVEVMFDKTITSFDDIVKFFFEIHDPTQYKGQGPDLGEQYSSVIFYHDENQKNVSKKYMGILESEGYKVVTELREYKKCWPAETYHQDYYTKTKKEPYCHRWVKRF